MQWVKRFKFGSFKDGPHVFDSGSKSCLQSIKNFLKDCYIGIASFVHFMSLNMYVWTR